MQRAAEVVSDNSQRFFFLLFLGGFAVASIFGKNLSAQELHLTSTNFSIIPSSTPVKTLSRFTYTFFDDVSRIPYQTQYQKDPDRPYGETVVAKEGKNGQLVRKIRSTFYEGKIYAKETVGTETTPAEPKIVTIGTKQTPGVIQTPQGSLSYKAKFRVYATSYDKYCRGCNETTSIGMRAGYGVIAVDPTLIPLRSQVYIPGYGTAVAGDVGGAIKGARVDLGFDDVKRGFWSARYTDIYILQ